MHFTFLTGSQHLYGPETLAQVEANSREIVGFLNEKAGLPFPIEFRGVMTGPEAITAAMKQASFEDGCAGVITFCHTFSPSKMWMNGLRLLQKPWLHLHTQYGMEIPDGIDMDFMNLHQSAHGDREHGYIGAFLRLPRRVVAGHWTTPAVHEKVAKWMQACAGAAFSKTLKIMRFGDNMREVAVTEGNKTAAQEQFGWAVNTFPVGDLAQAVNAVTDAQVKEIMDEYHERYTINTDDTASVEYQARLEIAMLGLLQREKCGAFTNTFEDLHGLRQLPGLATQRLMARGYGYGGEGDWKTSAMTAILKHMHPAPASFMEDYTYDFAQGLVLGAHMLEVCPSIAADKPRIEVHPLSIGGKEPPARLVFAGRQGPAVCASMVDMGGRFRLIVQEMECVPPTKPMPQLPVARTMWKPLPCLETAAECWILAGGAHHTALSYGVDYTTLNDWARIMGVECVRIGAGTEPAALERELMVSDMIWGRK